MNYREPPRKLNSKLSKTNAEMLNHAGLAKRIAIAASVPTKRAAKIGTLRSFGKRGPANGRIFRVVATIMRSNLIEATIIADFGALLDAYPMD
jgi:hypothetical protein